MASHGRLDGWIKSTRLKSTAIYDTVYLQWTLRHTKIMRLSRALLHIESPYDSLHLPTGASSHGPNGSKDIRSPPTINATMVILGDSAFNDILPPSLVDVCVITAVALGLSVHIVVCGANVLVGIAPSVAMIPSDRVTVEDMVWLNSFAEELEERLALAELMLL